MSRRDRFRVLLGGWLLYVGWWVLPQNPVKGRVAHALNWVVADE